MTAIALVPTAVEVGGRRVVIQPGEALPEAQDKHADLVAQGLAEVQAEAQKPDAKTAKKPTKKATPTTEKTETGADK